MAVNPFLNPEIVSVNTVLLNRIEVYVDEKLRDGEWLKNQRRGTKEKQYYEIQFSRDDVRNGCPQRPTLTYSLNNNEKKFLQARYLEAGWHEVEVSNSDENGERAGIISVKLTHHASMTIIAIVTDHVNRHLSKRKRVCQRFRSDHRCSAESTADSFGQRAYGPEDLLSWSRLDVCPNHHKRNDSRSNGPSTRRNPRSTEQVNQNKGGVT